MTPIVDLSKGDKLYLYSNPIKAQKEAFRYLGKNAVLYKSANKHKKYAILDPTGKIINFGQLGYEDFLKLQNEQKRQNYLHRSFGIKVIGKIILTRQIIYLEISCGNFFSNE